MLTSLRMTVILFTHDGIDPKVALLAPLLTTVAVVMGRYTPPIRLSLRRTPSIVTPAAAVRSLMVFVFRDVVAVNVGALKPNDAPALARSTPAVEKTRSRAPSALNVVSVLVGVI